jgi:bifunctional DNA-binding transcriptional regulator/antitoxin component of YhaV-PrlF toxin-antitoxin module
MELVYRIPQLLANSLHAFVKRNLTFVERFVMLTIMQVKVSDKYQVVIPKAARRTMKLPKYGGYMTIKKVTPTEITYAVLPNQTDDIERFAGILKDEWGEKPSAKLRKMRDEEWS